MADFDLLRHTILIAVLIVIGQKILVRDVGRGRDFPRIHEDIFNLAFFRDRIVVAGLVAIVIGLQFLIGGMQAVENVALGDDGIVEFDLRVTPLELRAHLRIGHKDSTRDQRLELANQNVIFLQRFELGDGHVVALNELLVFFLADEFAVGK